jgi:hypothetical protein
MTNVVNYLTPAEWIFFAVQLVTVFGVGTWPRLSAAIARRLSA